MSARVSVVIPNFNHARFLPRRIESVLEQTFTDTEVLFLDDASTDQSRLVFANYASDPRVRALFNPTNSGSTFRQWNYGARETRGEYLWFAESDDYADPRLLERLVAALDANPQCGLAYCQSSEVDPDGNLGRNFATYTADLDAERWNADFVASGAEVNARYFYVKNILPNASAALLRRSAFEAAGGADEKMKLCGDWMLWARMLARSDLAFVAEPMNFFRHHPSSVRANRMRTLLYVCERYKIMEFIQAHAPVDAALREECSLLMAALWETYAAEDPHATAWHWRLYRAARRVDPQIRRRLYLKTLRPWLGGVKNHMRSWLATSASR